MTLIDRKLARDVDLRGQRTSLALEGISHRREVYNNCGKIDVKIQREINVVKIDHAITIPEFRLPKQSLAKEITRHIETAENITVESYDCAQAKILIGQDNWRSILTRKFREIQGLSLAVSRSLFGWVVHRRGGRYSCLTNAEVDRRRTFNLQTMPNTGDDVEEGLDELVRRYFLLDSLGASRSLDVNYKHRHAMEILEKTSKIMWEATWETGLLWKSAEAPIVDSRATARARLNLLEKKLDRNPLYAAIYYKEMDRFVQDGYAVKLEEVEERERVWYLPHFGVQNVNKPGKIRLVFDAAAKTRRVSLNDQLNSGPDLLQSLTGVLL